MILEEKNCMLGRCDERGEHCLRDPSRASQTGVWNWTLRLRTPITIAKKVDRETMLRLLRADPWLLI